MRVVSKPKNSPMAAPQSTSCRKRLSKHTVNTRKEPMSCVMGGGEGKIFMQEKPCHDCFIIGHTKFDTNTLGVLREDWTETPPVHREICDLIWP